MEVLRSFERETIETASVRLISFANISIGIALANTSTASSDTVLKPLIGLIAVRRLEGTSRIPACMCACECMCIYIYNMYSITNT